MSVIMSISAECLTGGVCVCVALYRPYIAQTGPPGSEWPDSRGDGPAEKVRPHKHKDNIHNSMQISNIRNNVKCVYFVRHHCFFSFLSLHFLPFLFFLLTTSLSVSHTDSHTHPLRQNLAYSQLFFFPIQGHSFPQVIMRLWNG